MAAATRSRGRSCRRHHYMCSITPPGMTGIRIQMSGFAWRRDGLPKRQHGAAASTIEGQHLQIETMWRQGTWYAAAPVPRHRPELTGSHQTVETICPGTEQGKSCRARKRPTPCGRGRGCSTSSSRRSSSVPSRVWGQEAAKRSRHRDPQRLPILTFSSLTRPWVLG